MKPEKQRIEIAKACGFTQEEPWLDGRECWGHKDHPSHIGFEEIPDYLNDLNAMWAAVRKGLTGAEQLRAYESELMNLSPDYPTEATASQRAEAFLKTLSLWKPE